jgi:hypothetical protein
MNRNIGLLRAISAPALFPSSSYCMGGFGPVRGSHNGQLFWRGASVPRSISAVIQLGQIRDARMHCAKKQNVDPQSQDCFSILL